MPFTKFTQLMAKAEGVPPGQLLQLMQKNSTSKQYNVRIDFVVTETAGDKPFFDSSIDYKGTHYAFVVAFEAELIALLERLNDLGKEIASGGEIDTSIPAPESVGAPPRGK